MTRATEIAWGAGVIEGEGTFGVIDNGRSAPRVSVGTTDVDVLARLLATFGIGNIYGPFQYYGAHKKPMWFWKAYNKNAIAIGMTIWPFLGERRRQRVTEMIQAWRAVRGFSRKVE